MNEYVCTTAADHGYLDILIWARENGCPWTEETYKRAHESGQIKVLEWLEKIIAQCS